MVGELAVDARKVALSKEQCLFVLEWSGELIGVAGQVGFFAGEAILRGHELGPKSLQEVEPLEEPDAVCRDLGHVERAGSCVLQRIAPLRAAQAQTNCAAGRRPHRHLKTAIGGDRRGRAGAGCLAGGEGLVGAAPDGGSERRSPLDPVGKDAPVDDEAEWLVAMCVRLRCVRITVRHISGNRLHARPKVGDPLRQPLELPAGLDLLVGPSG
jgi:hypothetical protein